MLKLPLIASVPTVPAPAGLNVPLPEVKTFPLTAAIDSVPPATVRVLPAPVTAIVPLPASVWLAPTVTVLPTVKALAGEPLSVSTPDPFSESVPAAAGAVRLTVGLATVPKLNVAVSNWPGRRNWATSHWPCPTRRRHRRSRCRSPTAG